MLNKKSEANLEIAIVCLDKKDESFFSVGASRAYYAIFQATKWLLVKNNLDYNELKKNNPNVNKQSDYGDVSIIIALIYFLRTNGFDSKDDLIFINELYVTFTKLFFWRLRADYEETVISKKNLEKIIKSAEIFINKLKKYN